MVNVALQNKPFSPNAFTVGDFKANFSNLLERVMNGEHIQVLYGKAKHPVAELCQIKQPHKRNIGTFEGRASFSEKDDGKITLEEFLGYELSS